MKVKEILTKKGVPEAFINVTTESGITEFYPPQAEAIEKGVLDGKSVLMSVPTAAGKTLIAELCMLRSILQNNGRCLYIAPLKALASEKYEDFKKKYSDLGVKVGIATGDLDSPSKMLNRYQILIATAEKVDSLLRSRAKWLINSLNVVVLDEIHFINDGSRGPTMEILTARIKHLNPNIQFLALSATVSNAQEMADWLNSELVASTWRPIPLREGVYFNEAITFQNTGTRLIKENAADDLSKIVLDTLRGKGQVLVFVGSRRSAQAASRQVSKAVSMCLTIEEKTQLQKIAKEAVGASDGTKVCRKLAECIVCGSAFHHAGLKPKQRKLIEDNFKKNIIKVICSTPTLAAGVNLPARRTVLRDCKRFESGLGAAYIPTSEYKQCAGRAGRPQYDKYGEAVLVAKSLSESQVLFDKYILADPEPVISKLANESALRIHILASIAGGYVHDVKGMLEFISHTFLAHQKRVNNLLEVISDIFEFLEEEKFIEKSGFRFFATELGQATSRLYIDPISAITIRNGIEKALDNNSYTDIGMLHLLCCCPDSPLFNVGKRDYEELELFASNFQNDFIFDQDNYDGFDDLYYYLATLKTSWLLLNWIEEAKEESMCDQFNVGPGDIYRATESINWLLHASVVIAELFNYRDLTFTLRDLQNRVRYGVQEDLLELVHLKGVGRVRARILYEKGFKTLNDFKFITADELSGIKQIGKALAKDILSQITKPRARRTRSLT